MTTSQPTPSIYGSSYDVPLTAPELAYERERLRHYIHHLILGEFVNRQAMGLTRAIMARRLNKRPEQITRWLASPGNWESDTMSDLLFAMGVDPTSIFRQDPASTPSTDAKAKPPKSAAHNVVRPLASLLLEMTMQVRPYVVARQETTEKYSFSSAIDKHMLSPEKPASSAVLAAMQG